MLNKLNTHICFTFILTFLLRNCNGSSIKSSGFRPIVFVNKCCALGENLDVNQTCTSFPSTKWWPWIYMVKKKKFYDIQGEAPPFIKVVENVRPKNCTNIKVITANKGEKQFVLFSDGNLYLTEKSLMINSDEYCIDKDIAMICFRNDKVINNENNLKTTIELKKCCTRDMVYNKESSTCQAITTKIEHPINQLQFSENVSLEIIYGIPYCNSMKYAIADIFNPSMLDISSGNLTLYSGRSLNSGSYCIEFTVDSKIKELENNINQIVLNSSNENQVSYENISEQTPTDNKLHVITCSENFLNPINTNSNFKNTFTYESHNQEEQNLRFKLLAAGLFISVIFLIATLASGFLMPSNHHVLHWKCQSYYVSCLLIGDFLLAINQIAVNQIVGISCILIAILMHFFFLAAFFWLNTMCFNIWWTFRDFRPTALEKNQEILRLRIYSTYAWGVPLIIVSIAAVLDLLPEGEQFLRPRFGEKKCWFYGDLEILTYFFGPIGVLLIINLILFGSTARQLTCGLWKIDDVKSTTEKAALGRVCFKLVIVMGVTWVADIVSWMVGGHWYIWVFTDLINALQGLFIFIVVGCQPQVWFSIKRIWTSRTGRGVSSNVNGPQHSSSSHGLPSIGETITNNTLTNTNSTKAPMETVC